MAEGETRYVEDMPDGEYVLSAWCDDCDAFRRSANIDELDDPLVNDFQKSAIKHELDDQGKLNGHHAHFQIKMPGAYDTTRPLWIGQ